MHTSSTLFCPPSPKRRRKLRKFFQGVAAGAAVSLALYPRASMAQVTTTQPSLYDSYKLTDHPYQIVTVPDYEATPAFPSALYPSATFLSVDTGTDAAYVPGDSYGTNVVDPPYGVAGISGLNLRQAIGIANYTGGQFVITANVASNYLTTDNGPIIIDNPNTQIIFKAHNFRAYQGTSGSAALSFPVIDVQAGSVLFYSGSNSPSYAEFPIKIDGTGKVNVFGFQTNGAEINLTEIDNSGSFIGNRYVRVNNNPGSATTPLNLGTLNLNDSSYFELGENNSINANVNVNGNSTFILNGGNVLSSGEPSPNTLTGNLNIGGIDSNDSDGGAGYNAYAVLGIQNTITGDVNVNNYGTLRSLGPTNIGGNLTFADGSTFIASLGTPVNAQEFHFNSAGTGYTTSTSPGGTDGTTPNDLTDAGTLAYWNTTVGLGKWTTAYPNFATQMLDPNSTINGSAGYYTPPVGTYLLKVGGNITIDDGATMVLDSLGSLNIGQKYIIFKVNSPEDLTGSFTIDNALPTLSFAETDGNIDLDNETDGIDGLTDYYVTLTGVNFSGLDLTGANKEQRSFFNYLDDITSPPPQTLLPGANSALAWIISNYNALGPDTANSFLGDTYTAHAAQTYWNQQAFISTISDQLNTHSSMSGDTGVFSMNNNELSGVQGQLSSLSQSMNPSAMSLSGALDANGNNGSAGSGLWASAYGNRVDTKSNDDIGSPQWDGDTTGFAAGYTGGSEHFNWGVAVGHQKSNLSFDDRTADGELDGYNVGLYAALNRKHSYLNGILSYSHFDNDATRDDEIGANASSFNSHGVAAQLEYGLRVSHTKTSDFTPYASLLWSNSDTDGFSETGTGAGLTLGSSSNSIETTQLGLRYNHRTYDKSDTLKGGIQAGIAWVHQFGDTDFPMAAQFTGTTGSFTIYNTPLSDNAVEVQLGAYGRIHNNLVGFAGYQGTFGSDEHINSVTGGIGYQF